MLTPNWVMKSAHAIIARPLRNIETLTARITGSGKREHRGAVDDDGDGDEKNHDEPGAEARAVVEEDQDGAGELDDGGNRDPEGAERESARASGRCNFASR